MKHIAKLLIFTLLVSLLCAGSAALAADNDYVGVWEYDDYYSWYEIGEDGTWAEYSRDGMQLDGWYETDDDGVTLYLPDGSVGQSLTRDGDTVADSDGDTLFKTPLPAFNDSEPEALGMTGCWQVEDDDCWTLIYPASTFAVFDDDGLITVGYLRLKGDDTLLLLADKDDDDEDAIEALTFEDGTFTDTEGETFTPSALPFDHDSVLSGGVMGDYAGVWEYDEYDLWFHIGAAGTWAVYNDDGMLMDGYGTADGDTLDLCVADGSVYTVMQRDGDALTDAEGDTMFLSSLPEFPDSELEALDLTGVWELEDEAWMVIYSGYSGVMYDADGPLGTITLTVIDDDTIELEADGNTLDLTINDDGNLESEDGEVFVPSELPF